MKHLWAGVLLALTCGFVGCRTHSPSNMREANIDRAVLAEKHSAKVYVTWPVKKLFTGGAAELSLGELGPNNAIISTRHIEWVDGGRYGWDIWLRSHKPTVLVKTVFTLPAQARWTTVGGDGGVNPIIAADGTQQSWEADVKTRHSAYSIVKPRYRILPDDPKGLHNLKVYLDGEIVFDVDFWIE